MVKNKTEHQKLQKMSLPGLKFIGEFLFAKLFPQVLALLKTERNKES